MNPGLRRAAETLGLMGRTKRTSILLFIILSGAAQLVFWFVLMGEARRGGRPSETLVAAVAAWPWIDLALSLAFTWLAWRRFQDHDRPGWLALVPTAYVYALWLSPVPLAALLPEAAALIGLAMLLAFLVGLFLPPTVGPNRYGPDPRGWRSPEHLAEERRQGRAT